MLKIYFNAASWPWILSPHFLPPTVCFSFVAHFFCLVVGCVFYFQFVCIAISHTIFSWPVLFFQTSFAGLGSVLVMVSVDGE